MEYLHQTYCVLTRANDPTELAPTGLLTWRITFSPDSKSSQDEDAPEIDSLYDVEEEGLDKKFVYGRLSCIPTPRRDSKTLYKLNGYLPDTVLSATAMLRREWACFSSVSHPAASIDINVAAPGYAQFVKKVMDADPDVVTKAVAKQFAHLAEAALKEATKKPLVIVIDALDECEGCKGLQRVCDAELKEAENKVDKR
ncbi:hypothetical protein FBULB1_7601 [Fusarium bulbicola]|nr:hypothetical protein FBULB1_7601 [Fusarium bulbicola]